MGVSARQPLGAMPFAGSQGPSSDFLNLFQESLTWQINIGGDAIHFPWSDKGEKGWSNCIGGSAKHDIALDGANPSVQVNDLRAYNANKERTVTYDGTYGLYDGSDESPNNQSIQVVGKGHASHGDKIKEADPLGGGIERRVDGALSKCIGSVLGGTSSKGPSKCMNIDIIGISASAVNMAEEGSAVVNNNTIVKPVQIIYVPYKEYKAVT